MLLNEALKQRPELRMSSKMVNRIESLIDLPRVRRLKKEPLEDERVRKLAAQAEAVYVSALIKSVVMSEIEAENPRFVQYVKGFKVKRNALFKPPFYALQAFEDNGSPIDHLITKKQAMQLLQKIAITAQKNF